jgi:uncharacterized protein
MEFSGFHWDYGNRSKCQKHGVSIDEIEELFQQEVYVEPDPRHSKDEERFKAIARSAKGRAVFVVFTMREREGSRLIRPISARPMHRKEIRAYEKAAKETSASRK